MGEEGAAETAGPRPQRPSCPDVVGGAAAAAPAAAAAAGGGGGERTQQRRGRRGGGGGAGGEGRREAVALSAGRAGRRVAPLPTRFAAASLS